MPLKMQASPIDELMTRVKRSVNEILSQHQVPEAVSPASFEALEEAIHRLMSACADQIVAAWLSGMLVDAGLEAKGR